MTRAITVAVAVWVALVAAPARAEDAGSPHHMTKSDGSLDTDKCALCHNEDFSLQRSKLETCTLCHATTAHAGSSEHLRAAPPAVKALLTARPEGSLTLPLAEDGHMYCGSCHLFHDPKVTEENWLKEGWIPPDSGMPGAVRQSVIERWAALAAKSEDKPAIGTFATQGTRQLRLPVDDGQLCQQCHRALQ